MRGSPAARPGRGGGGPRRTRSHARARAAARDWWGATPRTRAPCRGRSARGSSGPRRAAVPSDHWALVAGYPGLAVSSLPLGNGSHEGRREKPPSDLATCTVPRFPTAQVKYRQLLAASPDGIALLGEGDRAFTGVLRGHHRPRDLALLLPCLGLRPVARALDDLLRGLQRERAVGGDRTGELERRVYRAAGLGQAVDDAQLVSALGVDRVAGERQLHRHVVRNSARDAQERAAGGDEAALRLRDAQTRPAGGDDQVAGQGDLEPAGHGEAL